MTAMTDPQITTSRTERRICKALKSIVANRDGWDLKRLSIESGITYQRLCQHLNGKDGGLTLAELEAILDALEITLADLAGAAESGGLLLSTHLHLVAANDAPRSQGPPRRPLLQLVKS